MIHSARNSARGRERSHEMKGFQPSLWEQGLPAQEKPPAKLVVFLVMMIVMILTFKLGLNRFRKQNIIETLKDDM